MGIVTRTIGSSHPDALLPLCALVAALGLSLNNDDDDDSVRFSDVPLATGGAARAGDDDDDDDNNNAAAVEMVVQSYNPFNTQGSTFTAKGMTGVARALCAVVPEAGMWGEVCIPGEMGGSGGGGNVKAGAVESWVEVAVSELSGAAFFAGPKRGQDPHFKSLVERFARCVESHLFQSSCTYLVGDIATAADVIGAILLAIAARRTGVKSVPQQCARWIETMLCNPVIAPTLERYDIPIVKCGEMSPMEKQNIDTMETKETQKNKEEDKKNEKQKLNETKKKSDDTNESKSMTLSEPLANTATANDDLTSTATSTNPIMRTLHSLQIPHRTYAHVPCITAEELQTNVPLPLGEVHTKNVLFKDKKHGLFLVTTVVDADVSNTKELGKALKLEGKTNLRLATEDVLMTVLGCKKGCVGPLAIVHNTTTNAIVVGGKEGGGTKDKVTLVLDEELLRAERVHSHPMRNDASTVLEPSDLKRYLSELGVEPVILPFPKKKKTGTGADVGVGENVDDAKKKEQWAGKAPSSRPPDAHAKKEKEEKPSSSSSKQQQQQQQQQQQPKEKGTTKATTTVNKDKKTVKKGETLLALQWKKNENFPMWYSDVIVLSEMISYYDISGCYILRPWSYKMWEMIQDWFNDKIRALGVENSYFPLFVSQDRLEKEKDHVEGFAPEVAWVTKSGNDDLAKHIAIRPTSETIMYPAFSDWIKSHRDLPLKLNQWSNVVRWEFKYPTPFLRSREFLWQEGHTAHVSYDDAQIMVRQALDLYRDVYQELLAVPVVPGYKTEKEKFAGGHQTTTVEAYIAGSGRAIQGATSHNLGQNFGKMFDITFQDDAGKTQIAWQTSWGLTTRTIGVMVMVHGDDTGLVLPPRIAPIQVVIVPIITKKFTLEHCGPYCEDILTKLGNVGVRVKFDDRTMYNPGWKYNHWEQKGVPIRIEVGPRDMDNESARIVIRHSGDKSDLAVSDLPTLIPAMLETIQGDMFAKAKSARDGHIVHVTEWKDFVPNLELNNLVLTPWCGGEHQDWEEWVKDKSREESLAARGEECEDTRTSTSVAAKTLCIPFEQPDLPEGTKCIASGLPATCWVLWGRSY